MQIRQLNISRYRGIEELTLEPGSRTVFLGPQNAGKSSILEAMDLLLHHGFGRRRRPPTEIDYFNRDIKSGFEIEAVIGDLTNSFLASTSFHLEGWKRHDNGSFEIVPEPDGDTTEPVIRVRARGTEDLRLVHEFAKPESEEASFNPAYRIQVGWVFDGRRRDPAHQLAFYQGGLLDRLFSSQDADLDPATDALKKALKHGAEQVNIEPGVDGILTHLATDLQALGLLDESEKPLFEAGDVSQRKLLQSLTLAIPIGDEIIPLFRQGRGAQRLVLVSVLLRLAKANLEGETLIGGFEEPEEALEPLRQAQLSDMLIELADQGGQVFVVTHSPEIARRFEIDDFVLLDNRAPVGAARALRDDLSPSVRQTYERRLDGAVVRGLFGKVPVLVEGPSDRAVFDVFWHHLVQSEHLRTAAELGLELVNCEGAPHMPMLAAVLKEAGKHVVAWVEGDVPEQLNRLQSEANCAAMILYQSQEGCQNLEEAIANSASLAALEKGLTAIAVDRGYDWDDQRLDLVSRVGNLKISNDEQVRIKNCDTLGEIFSELDENIVRKLIASALSSKKVSPFEMKGGRQARILASAIVEEEGVPRLFSKALIKLEEWIVCGCQEPVKIQMEDD